MEAEYTTAFWLLAEELLGEPDVEKGTLMGTACLRARGKFLATVQRKTGHLVVKLSADRVLEIVEEGVGLPFAPAGRVFKEWVAVPTLDVDVWRGLLREGLQIARAA